MSATGIGASVRRKEDRRFITGTGHYTDDINRPGQAYAYFVRSPHAHATIKSIDAKAAAAMPGVLAVLTGAELATDKIGNLICGWMIHSKDGSPMKMAAHPALANGKACHVGDPVAVVVAESARPGARRRREGEGRLRRVARRRRSGCGAEARRAADPRRRTEQHDLSVAPRRRQSGRCRVQGGEACHQARHRQQSAGAERHRAARCARRIRFRHRRFHAVEHDAESACRAAGHRRLRRHGAGA